MAESNPLAPCIDEGATKDAVNRRFGSERGLIRVG